MCDACKQIALEARVLIDAIDKNREAITELMTKIHHDMNDQLVLVRGENNELQGADFNVHRLGPVMLLNYVTGFLNGEFPARAQTEDATITFLDQGYDHGRAYATVRKSSLN